MATGLGHYRFRRICPKKKLPFEVKTFDSSLQSATSLRNPMRSERTRYCSVEGGIKYGDMEVVLSTNALAKLIYFLLIQIFQILSSLMSIRGLNSPFMY